MKEAGFSLIDVIFATGLLSLGAYAAMNVKNHAQRSLTQQKLIEEVHATRRHIRENFSCLNTLQKNRDDIQKLIDLGLPTASEVNFIPLTDDMKPIFKDDGTLYSDRKISVKMNADQEFYFEIENGNRSIDIFNGIPKRCLDLASLAPVSGPPSASGNGCKDVAIVGLRYFDSKVVSNCESLANGRCAIRMESFTRNTSSKAGSGIMRLKGAGACSIRFSLQGARPAEHFNCGLGYPPTASTPAHLRQNCNRGGRDFEAINLPPSWSFVFPAASHRITTTPSDHDYEIITSDIMPAGWHYHDTDLRIEYLDCAGNPIGSQCQMKLDLISPLVFNPHSSSKPQFIDLLDSKVSFDLNSDSYKEQTAWMMPEWWFIAFDHNQNGIIDDGSELFGEGNGFSNGFEALATFDSNKDGLINRLDDRFHQLLAWRDNGNGITEEGELTALEESGLTEINLKYTEQTRNIKQLSSQTLFKSNGTCFDQPCKIYDVYFQSFRKIVGTND